MLPRRRGRLLQCLAFRSWVPNLGGVISAHLLFFAVLAIHFILDVQR